jgi:hypothetical protein
MCILEWITFEELEAQETWMGLMTVLELPEIVDERADLDGVVYADHLAILVEQWANNAGPCEPGETIQ